MNIKVVNLSKKYGNKIILNNISYEFDNNYINFILGGNGTGKSTLIKCLLSLTTFEGEIIKQKEAKIAYAPERVMLPDYLTVNEFIKIFYTDNEYLVKRIMNDFGLQKYLYQNIITLSKGTKQKLIIISTILKKADIYIFDEPLSGLDDNSLEKFKQYIKELFNDGKIIIIATHLISSFNFHYKKIFTLNRLDNDETN